MKHSYRSQFPSVGPKTAEKLQFLGIQNVEQLEKLGTEKVMELYVVKKGGRQHGMCSCLAYQFEAIIRRCAWNKIPQKRKEELKVWTKTLQK